MSDECPMRNNEFDQHLATDQVVVAGEENVSSRVAEEEVILNLRNGSYYGLDPIGARIWELIQEPTSVGDLVERLVASYEVDREQCLADVSTLLHEMREHELVEFES